MTDTKLKAPAQVGSLFLAPPIGAGEHWNLWTITKIAPRPAKNPKGHYFEAVQGLGSMSVKVTGTFKDGKLPDDWTLLDPEALALFLRTWEITGDAPADLAYPAMGS